MAAIAIFAVVFLVVALGVRMILNLVRFAVILIACLVGTVAILTGYRVVRGFARIVAHDMVSVERFVAAHRVFVAAEAVVAIVVLAGIIALWILTADHRRRLRGLLASATAEIRMRRAVAKLRRARRPVTLRSVATAAHVDNDTAMAWLTSHPCIAMPPLTGVR